ncbi:hypothetical protein R6Y99_11085 [Pseudomonas lundensis]|uniref:hypothetical protein n=1 Tax=Serratia proteamaculans TaxID=28151 RepID=UPI0029822816|nr:hypothetical protein [Serratia proteamaculans]MDW5500332.1 hypothetical protein [Serratia proteamaculans]MDW5505398.1 hypothetical protein [Pseudomonas lundensis]
MKKVLCVSMATSLLLLTACSSTNNVEKVTAANGSSIGVKTFFALPENNNNQYADTKLRVVTQADTGVGVGLSVLTSVLAGGLSASTFSKDTLKGSSVDTLPEPTKSYLVPKAKAVIADWLQKNGAGYSYKNNLNITPAKWLLVYQELSKSDTQFELRYAVTFYKRPEGGSMFSAFDQFKCSPTPRVASLAQWQASDYAMVKQVTTEYMDNCLSQLDGQLTALLKR